MYYVPTHSTYPYVATLSSQKAASPIKNLLSCRAVCAKPISASKPIIVEQAITILGKTNSLLAIKRMLV